MQVSKIAVVVSHNSEQSTGSKPSSAAHHKKSSSELERETDTNIKDSVSGKKHEDNVLDDQRRDDGIHLFRLDARQQSAEKSQTRKKRIALSKNRTRSKTTAIIESDEDSDADEVEKEEDSGSEYCLTSEEETSEDESMDSEYSMEDESEIDCGASDEDHSKKSKKQNTNRSVSSRRQSVKSKSGSKLPDNTPGGGLKTQDNVNSHETLSTALTSNGVSITPRSMPSTHRNNANGLRSNRPRFSGNAKEILHRAFDSTPSVPTPSIQAVGGQARQGGSPPVQINGIEDGNMALKFAARDAARFPFLHPDRIRDANKRRPSDPRYNPSTLYIPPEWFKQNKISEGQRQWWEFKAANWGSVLLFKVTKRINKSLRSLLIVSHNDAAQATAIFHLPPPSSFFLLSLSCRVTLLFLLQFRMLQVGKFYEMFEMDAHVGSEVLGLSYMKGEQPHCGFPEANYSQMAERLARAGHRVVVVEQTETPEALAKRNEERKRSGLKKDTVVRREKVAVLTRGTLADPEMTSTVADAQYVMSIVEMLDERSSVVCDGSEANGGEASMSKMPSPSMMETESTDAMLPSERRTIIGVAAADVSAGRLLIGQWRDDDLRSGLRAVVTALQPAEVIVPRNQSVSSTSRKMLVGASRCPLVVELPLGDESGYFWSASKLRATLRDPSEYDFFVGRHDVQLEHEEEGRVHGMDRQSLSDAPGKRLMPQPLQDLINDYEDMAEGDASTDSSAMALGGLLSYLKSALMDKSLLAAGTVESLHEVVSVGDHLHLRNSGSEKKDVTDLKRTDRSFEGPRYASLDGSALENLEILESSEGTLAGTLLAALDHCATPFGRRRLKQWLCRPLARTSEIIERQDAVEDLLGPAEEAAACARRALSGIADLERVLTKLCATGAGFGPARDAPRVIIYEDVAKKRVKTFLHAIESLKKVGEAVQAFQALEEDPSSRLSSTLLKKLVMGQDRNGKFPNLQDALEEIEKAADWEAAEASGRVVPTPGVDKDFDAAERALENAEKDLENYLVGVRKMLKSGSVVRYVSLNKETHVIEAPEGISVPHAWQAMQGKKGIKRYTNDDLRGLIATREAAILAKEVAQNGMMQTILTKFAANRELWMTAVDVTADLDALMSLAVAAVSSDGPTTRPVILAIHHQSTGPNSGRNTPLPVFKARGLRHPAGVMGTGGSFVPNDVELGGVAPQFVVLTGPNMGGKSTLMRQVCLAAICAQIGAWVPADAMELVPVDALFVRMGARDRILAGQSTFFVEMSETAAALSRATPLSLVALDELGRGTATADGEAIAASVLDYLAGHVRCRGVFATHYHRIAESHALDSNVAIKHMACAVTPSSSSAAVDEVAFLYRLVEGACPKSYGVNVARLAGLPEPLLSRAATISERVELQRRGGCDGKYGELQEESDGGSQLEEASIERLAFEMLRTRHLSREAMSIVVLDLHQRVQDLLVSK